MASSLPASRPGDADTRILERFLRIPASLKCRAARRHEDLRHVRVAHRDAQVAAAGAQLVAPLYQRGNSCRIEMGDLAQVEDDAPGVRRGAGERVIDGPERVAIELAPDGDGRF